MVFTKMTLPIRTHEAKLSQETFPSELDNNSEIDDLYNVAISKDDFKCKHSQDSAFSDNYSERSLGLNLHFGPIKGLRNSRWLKFAASRKLRAQYKRQVNNINLPDPKKPYPGHWVKFCGSVANPLSLTMFTLAILAALFSFVVKTSLLSSSEHVASECSRLSNTEAIPYVVDALKFQTIKGINSTIWNMEQTALTNLDVLAQNYNYSANICHARNNASANATNAFVNWTTNSIDEAKQSYVRLTDILSSIETTLQSSGLVGQMTNTTKKFPNFTVPRDYNELGCDKFTANFSNLKYARQNVTRTVNEARQNLLELVKTSVPIPRVTNLANCGKGLKDAASRVERKTRIVVSILAVLGGLIMISTAFYYSWEWRNGRAEYISGDCNDPLQIAFNVRHPILSRISINLAPKLHGVIMHNDSFLAQTRMQWCINFCFIGGMRKLLMISLFLALACVIMTIILIPLSQLSSDNSPGGNAAGVGHLIANTYSSFEKTFNDQSYDIILNLLRHLNANHVHFASQVAAQSNLKIVAEALFPSGVAFEQLNLLFPNQTFVSPVTIDARSLSQLGSWSIFKEYYRLQTYLWASSLSFFGCWLLASTIICGFVIFNTIKADDRLRER